MTWSSNRDPFPCEVRVVVLVRNAVVGEVRNATCALVPEAVKEHVRRVTAMPDWSDSGSAFKSQIFNQIDDQVR